MSSPKFGYGAPSAPSGERMGQSPILWRNMSSVQNGSASHFRVMMIPIVFDSTTPLQSAILQGAQPTELMNCWVSPQVPYTGTSVKSRRIIASWNHPGTKAQQGGQKTTHEIWINMGAPLIPASCVTCLDPYRSYRRTHRNSVPFSQSKGAEPPLVSANFPFGDTRIPRFCFDTHGPILKKKIELNYSPVVALTSKFYRLDIVILFVYHFLLTQSPIFDAYKAYKPHLLSTKSPPGNSDPDMSQTFCPLRKLTLA